MKIHFGKCKRLQHKRPTINLHLFRSSTPHLITFWRSLSIILFSWSHTSPCHELLFSFLCYCPCGLNNTRAASSYSIHPSISQHTCVYFKLKVNLMDLIPLFLLKNHAESFSTKGLFSTFLIFYCDKEAFHETIQLFENNWTLSCSLIVWWTCVWG